MLRGANIMEANDNYQIIFAYNDGVNDVDVRVPAIAKGDIDLSKNLVVGYVRKFNGVVTFVMVDDEEPKYEEPELPNRPVEVGDIFAQRAIYCTKDGLMVAPEAIDMTIYDINGRIVATTTSSVLNVSVLNRGIYIVRSVYADGRMQTTKIVK